MSGVVSVILIFHICISENRWIIFYTVMQSVINIYLFFSMYSSSFYIRANSYNVTNISPDLEWNFNSTRAHTLIVSLSVEKNGEHHRPLPFIHRIQNDHVVKRFLFSELNFSFAHCLRIKVDLLIRLFRCIFVLFVHFWPNLWNVTFESVFFSTGFMCKCSIEYSRYNS